MWSLVFYCNIGRCASLYLWLLCVCCVSAHSQHTSPKQNLNMIFFFFFLNSQAKKHATLKMSFGLLMVSRCRVNGAERKGVCLAAAHLRKSLLISPHISLAKLTTHSHLNYRLSHLAITWGMWDRIYHFHDLRYNGGKNVFITMRSRWAEFSCLYQTNMRSFIQFYDMKSKGWFTLRNKEKVSLCRHTYYYTHTQKERER